MNGNHLQCEYLSLAFAVRAIAQTLVRYRCFGQTCIQLVFLATLATIPTVTLTSH